MTYGTAGLDEINHAVVLAGKVARHEIAQWQRTTTIGTEEKCQAARSENSLSVREQQ